ncbi:MAG TPA: class I SAM-dependent methyltransferase [Mesorhizobium sp.]|jgi:SAM-dependent MidA family methyltransferase|nr:class I SAM-dependent methyltransferase [Mesorhizobium sp.]
MTALAARLKRRVQAAGPMSVAEYMSACLLDPADGYYTTRMPFGAAGDFTTAPEISQMFGELAAVWLFAAWEASGRPAPVLLAELGPGRGTMMRDMLQAWARLDRDNAAKLEIALVEASPQLAALQRQTLGPLAGKARWHASVEELPGGPTLFVGNEIFDALPVRQYQFAGGRWHERVVGLDEKGELSLMLGPGAPDPKALPQGVPAPERAVWEVSPAREVLMEQVAGRLEAHGGAGLFFDYGHLEPAYGDTLQAVRKHRPEPVLASPGEADLTSHVDFSALAATAQRHGLDAWTATQGDFLLAMGLLERAGRLGGGADAEAQARIRGEVERLAGPDAMGTLFKVLAVAKPEVKLPALRSTAAS